MSRIRQTRAPRSADEILILRSLALGLPARYTLPGHEHTWDQLVYASAGVLTVRTTKGTWVVPPQRAVWVPAGVEHTLRTTGAVDLRTVYIRVDRSRQLPRRCAVFAITPLLRELVLTAVAHGMLDESVQEDARFVDFLVDRLAAVETVPLDLPMPRDARACRVAEALLAEPGDTRPLDELAAGSGASARTLQRRFLAETGMPLGHWRRKVRLLASLSRLAAGEAVTSVAMEVGYESPSAFIAAFKETLGTTPGRWLAG